MKIIDTSKLGPRKIRLFSIYIVNNGTGPLLQLASLKRTNKI